MVLLIKVYKSKRLLEVIQLNEVIRSFPIDLGREPIGAKQFEGDNKTPEGLYTIDNKSDKSIYFLNLNINYPQPKDMDFAKAQGKDPGSLIKIHGQPNDPSKLPHYPCKDWTAGCIAVSNEDMKDLFHLIPLGTTIEILP